MESILKDFRYAIRSLVSSPGFLAVAILTLAIGIGANTAIFSVVNGVLLKPLPYPEPDRILQVHQTNEAWIDSDVALLRWFALSMPVSYPRARAWEVDNPVFEHLASYQDLEYSLTRPDRSEPIEAIAFTGDLFGVLGVQPLFGRTFLPEEDEVGAERVVVLSYGTWQNRYGGDREVIGKTMILDGDPYTIVGVMPREFYFPERSNELYTFLADEDRDEEWDSQWLRTIGRLAPGVSEEEALAGMEVVQSGINEIDPSLEPDEDPMGIRLISHLDEVVGDTRPTLVMLLAAVGLVLLVACANIANLLLVRATGRRREVAVRAALGAGRGRLARQFLVESVMLAMAGGIVGLAVAYWSLGPLRLLIPGEMPRIDDVGIDPSVLGFTVLVSLLVGLLFGLAPAVQASRLSLATVLQESSLGSVGGARRSRSRSLLVVSEVAVTVVLLVGAALLVNSYMRLQGEERGFDTENLLTLRVMPVPDAFPEQQEVVSFQREVVEKISALPGVTGVTLATSIPFAGSTSINTFQMLDGELPEDTEARSLFQVVEPGYFRTMGIPLLRGRVFTEQDSADAPGVIIINEAMAERYWPGQDPIGKQIQRGESDEEQDNRRTIIGVVGNVKHRELGEEIEPKRYRPLAQEPGRYVSLAIRTASDPLEMAPLVRSTIWEVDNRVTLRRMSTMKELVSNSTAEPRFRTLLLSLLAGIAVALSMVGVYAVIAYSVAQGTREIGVRMALGADPGSVLRQVVLNGLRLALLGVVLGTGAALLATRVLESYVYEVSTTDPLTFVAVGALVIAVAILSTLIPARRATRIDPMVALRSE
jgi:putative ABC transport system permease protein